MIRAMRCLTWEVRVGVRDRMINAAASYLDSGEIIQAVFGAMSRDSSPRLFGGYTSADYDRVFVVTDKRIIVIAVKALTLRSQGLVAEFSRSTRLGPIGTAYLHQLDIVDGETDWVPRAFFQDIEDADMLRPIPRVRMPIDDAVAHADGVICQRCQRPIARGQAARRCGESDWIHDVCPIA